MPNDFVRWEEGGALVHHCPQCQTPLTNKRVKQSCLGIHVEWCKKYHFQLFKVGGSAVCMGCRGSDQQKYARHKEIAELIEELRALGNETSISHPRTPPNPRFNTAALNGSSSKKERKDARKAAKVAERAPVVKATEVERIGQILWPEEPPDREFEKSLLKDKSIENNLFYHAGTANSVGIRHHVIRQERSRNFDSKLSEVEMNRIISELKIPTSVQANSKKERAVVKRLRNKIADDFEHNSREARDTMARKTGFWRWASRKACNRLVARGSIWDSKSGEALAPDLDVDEDEAEETGAAMDIDAELDAVATAAGSIAADGDLEDETTSLITESSSSGSDFSRPSRNTSASSESQTTAYDSDEAPEEGWFTVRKANAKPIKVVTPGTSGVTLSGNGGLSHLKQATPRAWNAIHLKTPTKLASFGMLSVDDGGEDSTGDHENVSPHTPRARYH